MEVIFMGIPMGSERRNAQTYRDHGDHTVWREGAESGKQQLRKYEPQNRSLPARQPLLALAGGDMLHA
jgi:hypothetical protein